MDIVAMTVGIGWTLTGLLCLVLSIPLSRGKVPRNALYGARFRESFASDEAWFAINRFAGKRMMVWSLPLIALGVTIFFLHLQGRPGLTLFLGFAPLLLVLIPALESWRFARRFRA